MTLRRLVIVGAGGHGRETFDIVEAINTVSPTFELLGFADDGLPDPELLTRLGVEHLGGHGLLREAGAEYVLAVGSPPVRRHLVASIGESVPAATLVHPLASVGSDVHLGAGALLAAGSRVTTNVEFGRHSHLNVNAVVSHDCRIGDFVGISPGALLNGNVTVADCVFVGTGAVVLPGRHLGAGSTIGAGAVVTRDVEPGQTVAGVPAR